MDVLIVLGSLALLLTYLATARAVSILRGLFGRAPQQVAAVDPYDFETVALYRLYNEVGVLLYVGIAADPKKRFMQHAEDKSWWPSVATWKVEWFRDRATAAAEETMAIVKEAPAHNVSCAPLTGKSNSKDADRLIEELDSARIKVADLNYLVYFYVVGLTVSDDAPRTFWRREDITRVYRHAYDKASPPVRACHHDRLRFVDEWRTELLAERTERHRREHVAQAARDRTRSASSGPATTCAPRARSHPAKKR